MDFQGNLPGGILSTVLNLPSRQTYVISTCFEEANGCWTTAVVPCVERRSFFGLIKKSIPLWDQLFCLGIRNNLEDAHRLHAMVKSVVSLRKPEEWTEFGPDPLPDDGLNAGAQMKLKAMWGNSLSPQIQERFQPLDRKPTPENAEPHTLKQSSPARSKYQLLRENLGMDPAPDDSVPDVLAAMATLEIRDQAMAEQARKLPVKEAAQFLIAHACYVIWIFERGANFGLTAEVVEDALQLIDYECTKQAWYRPEEFRRIKEAMDLIMEQRPRGLVFKAESVLSNIIIAAKIPSSQLSQVGDLKLDLELAVRTKQMIETIRKIAED